MALYAAAAIPWIIGSTAVSAGVGIYAANKSASAARKNAQLMNDAEGRRLVYNTELWEMGWEQKQLNYNQDKKAFDAKKKNTLEMIAYQDKVATQQYNQQLAINQSKQKALSDEYQRSETLYGGRMRQNIQSEMNAIQQEQAKFQELQQEVSFENEELTIAQMEAAGKLAAEGQSGRSLAKQFQAVVAKRGYNSAKLAETVTSGARNMRTMLMEISLDKQAADLSAYSQRMLKPGKIPDPIKPLPTPVPEFVGPRALTIADKGPQPILGTQYSPSAAASAAWAGALPGIANSLTSGISMYGGYKKWW